MNFLTSNSRSWSSVCALFLLLSSNALAGQFTGRWSGQGQMTMKGKTTACAKVEVAIVATDSLFTVKKYSATCGVITPDWGPLEYQLSGEEIILDGESVGSFKNDTFLSTVPDGSVVYAINFKLESPNQDKNQDILKTYYGVKNMLGVIVIEGNLKRQ